MMNAFLRRCTLTILPAPGALVLLALLATAAAGCRETDSPQAVSPPSAEAVRVTFWNIEWFPGHRPNASEAEMKNQTNAVHAEMKKLAPDIVGMEEMRDWRSAELAVQPLSGFKVDVCSTFPGREGDTDTQQIAIASRFPALSAWAEPWKVGSSLLPRGFAFAAYEVSPGKVLLVYAVHLKSNRGELSENVAMREEMAQQLVAHMTAMETAYRSQGEVSWVVGGDFNTSLDDPRFAQEETMKTLFNHGYQWAWKDVPLPQRITLPARGKYPGICFDHILYKGSRLERAWVLENSSEASDHRAVSAALLPGAE